tara:strand:+ start:342 stop:911 length:570 start_codon:yes stop_codon:yes gene_type:complete
MTTDKRLIRRECFAHVGDLADATKADHSQAIVRHLSNSAIFREASSIFSYVAMASEPDLTELFQQNVNKHWAFSRVGVDDRLSFHKVTDLDDIHPGPLGFREPQPDKCPIVSPDTADLILIPGVGFDPSDLARIGRGRGHYDRYLNLALESDSSPVLTGVCFSVQLTALTPDAHDVPMTSLVTELGWTS